MKEEEQKDLMEKGKRLKAMNRQSEKVDLALEVVNKEQRKLETMIDSFYEDYPEAKNT